MNQQYRDLVDLLLRATPVVFESDHFALKGGTAINLFVQEMPRLSVDLDLVYVNHKHDREEALKIIAESIEKIRESMTKRGLRTRLGGATSSESKIFIQDENSILKVEINYVMRGTIFPVENTSITKPVQDEFRKTLTIPVLNKHELYASKFVAAMDRQHPRDLFDVYHLFQQEAISERMVEAFVCYLAGHPAPLHEVLFNNDKDITYDYENHFVGMPREEVGLKTLIAARAQLFDQMRLALEPRHKEFMLSLVAAEPDWSLMNVPHLKELSAIRWKLENLQKLRGRNTKKFISQTDILKSKLDEIPTKASKPKIN